MKRYSLLPLLVLAASAAWGALACSDSGVPTGGHPPQPPAVPPPQPPPPPAAPFGIQPAIDTVAVGDTAFFVAERADSTVDEWSVNDTTTAYPLARPAGRAAVLGGTPGTVTVKATRQGASGLATLVVVPRPPLPPQTFGDWEAIDLGVLDACGGEAKAINDTGTIVGRLWEPCYSVHSRGFVYEDGVMRKLRKASERDEAWVVGPSGTIAGIDGNGPVVWDTPEATPRRLDSFQLDRILGVNERGDVLGVEERGIHIGWGTTVIWQHGLRVEVQGFDDFALWYHPSTWATAWNSRGQVVGESQVADFNEGGGDHHPIYHAFVWENGVTRNLGVLAPFPCTDEVWPRDDCGSSVAWGINTQGVIVGQATDGNGIARAVVWENGVIRELGVFPGHRTAATAINDRGQILGTIGGDDWGSEPDSTFFWENGQVQLIAPQARARDVALSPNGEVIGTMAVGGERHAFVWKAGHLTDLGGAYLVHAINSRSEIVGQRNIAGHSIPTLWRKKRG
jgi:probable HAF family extracellular repeat protein